MMLLGENVKLKTTFPKVGPLFEIMFGGLRKIRFHNSLSPSNLILKSGLSEFWKSGRQLFADSTNVFISGFDIKCIQGRLLHINDGANAPWKK